jgi:membrane-associated phospholipid phosphatase
MALLVVLFIVAVLVTVGVGALSYRKGLSLAGGPRAWGEAAAGRLGAVPGAIVVAIVGYAITAGVGLALGYLAKHLESSIDKPVYNWVYPRVGDNLFSHAQNKLTLMGNNPIIQVVALIAVIALIFAYKRRFWIPIVGIALAVEGEKYMQKFLGKVIDRGHPGLSFPAPGSSKPIPTFGTYPSGGVGRILAVYGAIVVLVILLQPSMSRAWKAGLWTGLALMAVVESYSRIYLSKHWLTDAVFGLVFGALLLLSNIAAISALAWQQPRVEGGHRAGTADQSAPSGPGEQQLVV